MKIRKKYKRKRVGMHASGNNDSYKWCPTKDCGKSMVYVKEWRCKTCNYTTTESLRRKAVLERAKERAEDEPNGNTKKSNSV